MKSTLRIYMTGLVLMLIPGVTLAQRYLSEVFSNVTITTNVQYGENISIFPPPTPANIPLMLDVYEPANDVSVAQRPLIIFMHTGSYLPRYINGTPTGSRNDSATVEICTRLAKRGYVVANMDYRIGWNPAGSNVDIRRGTLLRSEEHTSELQSQSNLVCRLLLEKKKQKKYPNVLARSAPARSTRDELTLITKHRSRCDLHHTLIVLQISPLLPLLPRARSVFYSC